MGMLLLAKQRRQWLLLPRLSHHLLLTSFRRLLTGLRPFSNAATPTNQLLPPQGPPPPPPPPPEGASHFMVDYLVSSCGLSATDAMKASKHLAHVKSPEKPDAVLRLLKQTGLRDAQIRRLVRSLPTILVADPGKTLQPKIRALQEAGFSEPDLAQLISVNPCAIRLRDVVPKIEFWRKMVGDNEQLLKILRHTHLLGSNLAGTVNPNVSFLRSVGLSDADIVRLLVRCPRLVSSKLGGAMSIVEQVRRLGVAPGSGRFLVAVSTISNLSRATLEAKSKLLRSLGWSGDELVFAFQSSPIVLRLSEEKITRAMDFLVKEVGYKPSYIARHAVLLTYSVDNRLMPRYYALQYLRKKGLPGGGGSLLAAVVLPEKKFVERYIAPVSENVPELLETYPEVNALRNIMGC